MSSYNDSHIKQLAISVAYADLYIAIHIIYIYNYSRYNIYIFLIDACMHQVLSGSVAHALKLVGGEDAKETAKFVEYFDKFFDCLNVGDFESGKKARNPFKDPFRSGSDFRLKV